MSGTGEHAMPESAALDAALRRLAAEPVAPSRPIVEDALRLLRREGGFITTRQTAGGSDRWSEAALDRLAALAAREIDGVVHASAKVRPDDAGGLRVTVELVAAIGSVLPDLAEAVRERVTDRCAAAAGAPVGAVDVRVDDLV